MNKKVECTVFLDLYELYLEDEVEDETKQWMMKHEETCRYCQNSGKDHEGNPALHEDREKIWGIRVLTMSLYSIFLLLTIWMSIWYLW
ncbi:hypothetical protein [Halalkalibacter okhensis]|uniref:Zinc-finger domain-containing protein n=1 Tax=Halalkalibacter okhensis TaxID=333138 RepID=A0A0B0IGQ5_9BACI|nr:hypothetical protein [Halalkalibacter okhensis]KHF39244.1 hypothetical protein LQ50_16180 [Halalkalibacter okhensis]